MTSTELDTINEIVTKLQAAMSVPQARRLWGVEEIAAYSGYAVSTVQQTIVCRVDFPDAIRLRDNGEPRWVASKVMDWFEGHEGRHKARTPANKGKVSRPSAQP